MMQRIAHIAFCSTLCLGLSTCSSSSPAPGNAAGGGPLTFAPQRELGNAANNPAMPFLRFAPDGRLFAIWTEDAGGAGRPPSGPPAHRHAGKMAPSPMRNALLAASADGGRTWTQARRINTDLEPVQGEENGPKIAFHNHSKAFDDQGIVRDIVAGPISPERARGAGAFH